ncbi:hypothetical protein D2L64_20385 [Micromonospora radicis]|uniref:von Hippel-Lindau disease tumour suppressor beta domain-containing protein n=2 Tax=Micromonospora radicis TaxID=1894971 RepID=A0A418MQX2_9ACTN|nr:hypothetical protein D2L64_20385 [Micromonospora radicis]
MLTAFWPATAPPPTAAPDGPAGWIGPPSVGWPSGPNEPLPDGSVAPSSSVAGVSSTRPLAPGQASAATRLPSAPTPTRTATAGNTGAPSTRPATPSARPTTADPSPSGTTTSRPTPSRPPAVQDLTPLPGSRERGLRSVSGGPETSIEFVNLRSRTVIVYWLNHHGQRRQYAVLPPGASYRQHTYVGHPWVVTDRRGWALVCFEPTRSPGRAIIR